MWLVRSPHVSASSTQFPAGCSSLRVEKSALQRDGDGVGAIARVKLRENALEVALHRML
jgi:hypothetical protein